MLSCSFCSLTGWGVRGGRTQRTEEQKSMETSPLVPENACHGGNTKGGKGENKPQSPTEITPEEGPDPSVGLSRGSFLFA